MKKIVLVLISILFMMPKIVADTIDCGKYTSETFYTKVKIVNNKINIELYNTTLKKYQDLYKSSIKTGDCMISTSCPISIALYMCSTESSCFVPIYEESQIEKNVIKCISKSAYVVGILTRQNVAEDLTIPDKKNTGNYKEYRSCTNTDVNSISECGCMPAQLTDISSAAYFILRIIGPILLIVLGGIDMAKAIATEDDSAIKKAKTKLIKKAIAAASIFFVLTIFQFAIELIVSSTELKNQTLKCLDYLLRGYRV